MKYLINHPYRFVVDVLLYAGVAITAFYGNFILSYVLVASATILFGSAMTIYGLLEKGNTLQIDHEKLNEKHVFWGRMVLIITNAVMTFIPGYAVFGIVMIIINLLLMMISFVINKKYKDQVIYK